MRSSVRQTLVSWLCLICFGLSSNLVMGGLVFCQHSDGTSRLEWSECARDQDGSCLASCGGEKSSNDEQPAPCKDTPLKVDTQAGKACPRLVHPPAVAPVVVFAILAHPATVQVPKVAQASPAPRGRPPDTLVRLRTVVILV